MLGLVESLVRRPQPTGANRGEQRGGSCGASGPGSWKTACEHVHTYDRGLDNYQYCTILGAPYYNYSILYSITKTQTHAFLSENPTSRPSPGTSA